MMEFFTNFSNIEFVVLWTDVMVWLLLFALLFGIRSIRSSVQAKAQWHKIFESKIAMASGLILATYFLIALVDSVHFKIQATAKVETAENHPLSGQVLSGLDLIFSHLMLKSERTYSAPFAFYEYSSSVQTTPDGNVEQVYLPLKHVAEHLAHHESPQDHLVWDLFGTIGQTLIMSLIVVFVVSLIHLYLRFHRLVLHGVGKREDTMPWGTFYFTLFCISFLLIGLYALSLNYYVLGTDKVGQDVLYQSLKAIRTGVLIGLLTTLVMLPLALILGISAGYFKGWVDDLIQYLYTTLNSIPGVLLIAAAVLVMQSILAQNQDWFGSTEERADLRLLFLILILGITSWTGLCRLLRAETLKISQLEYVQSARAFGLSGFTIIRKHIAPNLMHLVLIALVLDFSGLVLAEAVLSYVGVGVDPTTPSWGNMINQARLEMAREPMVWWSLLSAFSFMFILVLSANLFSDRVQWVMDPRGKK